METQINMNQKEVIEFLLAEISTLKERVELLERQGFMTSSRVLEKIWDNEYDAEWDEA